MVFQSILKLFPEAKVKTYTQLVIVSLKLAWSFVWWRDSPDGRGCHKSLFYFSRINHKYSHSHSNIFLHRKIRLQFISCGTWFYWYKWPMFPFKNKQQPTGNRSFYMLSSLTTNMAWRLSISSWSVCEKPLSLRRGRIHLFCEEFFLSPKTTRA